ncbi:unnamed protein product [Cladocopium goreaui]|uniref:Uncharacterized protein n=1 Tax=Cladocopium goreaui TaxID=2562237 RepID=A0A9P1C0R7_9DINO|nr:unnamed protein product [Cladocopium goreaui]
MSNKRRLSADGTKPLKFKKVKEEETTLEIPAELAYVARKASLARETSTRSNRLEQSQSIGEYMAAKFNSKDSIVEGLLQFVRFVDEHFPPTKNGVFGPYDSEVCQFQRLLAALAFAMGAADGMQRCTTDANAVGVEKIAITFVDPSVAAPTHKLSANDVAPECDGMLSPTDVFVVKGWSRGISLLTILLAAFESPEFHQVWAKACEISEAYVVGKAESQAALHLYNDVSPRIALQHSMAKFLTHESIAAGAWNQNYCSATDTMQAWQETLTNTEQILDMTVDRMSRDWLSLAPKMRKAFTLKDVEYYQRSSAIFLACMSRFESEFPIDFVEKERPRIKRFDLKHGDAELVGMLEGAPPVDLERCGIFRTAIAKFQRQAEDEKVKASEEQLGWPASTKGCQAYQMHMQTCCNFNLTVVERQARFAAVSSLHKTFGFSKSHVFLGVLGPITRARVTELISDDADRPCSPAHRES